MILVSVLWILVLLSIISASLSASSRLDIQTTSNLWQAIKLERAQESAIQWAFWGLLAPAPQVPWIADGSVYDMQLDDIQLQVAVEDENGKIDLNAADKDMLLSLMIEIGLDETRADAISDAIMDWRDNDSLTRLNGAEDDDYQNAGYSYGSADAPFTHLAQLRKVMGVDDDLYTAMLPAITVHSGKALVNPLTSPKLVLSALTENSEEEIAEYIRDRRELHTSRSEPATDRLTSVYFSTSLKAVSYTVHTKAVSTLGTESGIVALVRRQGRPGQQGFKLLRIQQHSSPILKLTVPSRREGDSRE